MPSPLGAEAGLALYRAAEEALTNARKHAPGAQVTIRLNFEQERVTLLVANGQVSPGASMSYERRGAGLGLQGMREACRTARGRGRCRARPGRLERPRGGPCVKVLVVDDQTVVREGLTTLLGTLPGIEVVAAAADGEEALARVEEWAPDVVLMDLRMPRVDGVEATRRIRSAHPATQVVVLTTYADDDSIFGALRAGAIGYLTKDAGRDEIRRALEAAGSGQAVLDSEVQARLVEVGRQPLRLRAA